MIVAKSIAVGSIVGLFSAGGLFSHHDHYMQRIWPLGGVTCGLLGSVVAYNILRYQKDRYFSISPLNADIVYQGYSGALEAQECVDPTTFDEIIGLDSVIATVRELIFCLTHSGLCTSFGVDIPRGILLEGPPGTGKTMIARALACELKCRFLYASASSFVEMYVGVGAKRVRDLFNEARAHKPAVIFIDELDAIGGISRDKGANEEYRQTFNELLCQLDGFEGLDRVMIIAATNYRASLDKALLRSGRFDRLIKVPKPDFDGRYALFQHYKKKLSHALLSDMCLQQLSEKTKGFVAADIKVIFNQAAIRVMHDHANCIDDQYLSDACDMVLKERLAP